MKPNIGNYEYAARHQKARVLMEKNNLNALLITEPTNLFYFTGASYFGEMTFSFFFLFKNLSTLIYRNKDYRSQ